MKTNAELIAEARCIKPSDGDIGAPDDSYRDALDMLLDITGDNPPPMSRWGSRDWMRLLTALHSERSRADRNAAFVGDLADALEASEARVRRVAELVQTVIPAVKSWAAPVGGLALKLQAECDAILAGEE